VAQFVFAAKIKKASQNEWASTGYKTPFSPMQSMAAFGCNFGSGFLANLS
jgi:hypothetical protein